MKVSCLQENLAKGLSIVGRAVASKSTLPVLANVLLATDDEGRLKLSATNLEIGINCWVGAKVDQEGSTTVPVPDWKGTPTPPEPTFPPETAT